MLWSSGGSPSAQSITYRGQAESRGSSLRSRCCCLLLAAKLREAARSLSEEPLSVTDQRRGGPERLCGLVAVEALRQRRERGSGRARRAARGGRRPHHQ